MKNLTAELLVKLAQKEEEAKELTVQVGSAGDRGHRIIAPYGA